MGTRLNADLPSAKQFDNGKLVYPYNTPYSGSTTNGYMNLLPRYIACATHRLTLTSATLIHSLLKSIDITAALAPLCVQYSASAARNSDIIRVPSILLSLSKFGTLLGLNLQVSLLRFSGARL